MGGASDACCRLFRFGGGKQVPISISRGLAVAAVTILRRAEVEKKTGLSRSAIYALMARNKFPRPTHRLTAKAVGWSLEAIDAFLKSREVTW
jgi:prophage regulatory protein